MGEQLVTHWSKVYNLPSISLRCFNIYGPRARTSGTYGAVMGVFLSQKIHNKPLTIVGDGKQIRDFTFVSDVVDAIIVAAKSKVKNEIFNIGSGNPVSVNYIANKISNKKIYIPKRPGEPKVTHACNKKIMKFLSWKPKVSIDNGLELMIENIKYWKDAPLWTRSKIKKATKSWFEHLK
jgi:UDP-glucose 4-epimerase